MRTKLSTQRIRTLRRRRLALALVAAMAAPVAMAQDTPTGGSVVSGSATIGNNGNTMTITQTTKGAIINWGTFNIGFGYGVDFNQQFGSSSVTLNRVTGGSGSFIDGSLTANGHVFIVNTSGITFGSSSQVNVGGLVASTLAMSDSDFLTGLGNGRYRFSGAGQGTTVQNYGTITSGTGGVALVGPIVWNSGDITANGGNIVGGAGTTVTLDFVGDGLTQVTINGAPTLDSAVIQDRFGTMTADGGSILLRTAATAGGTGGAIYASGTLRAQTISNVAGRIELTSVGGPVMLGAPGNFSDANSPFTTGTIDVSGGSDEVGGSVLISGNGVLLVNDDTDLEAPFDPGSTGSTIDASGGTGGGNITILSTGSIGALGLTRIDASSGVSGNGGTIDMFALGGSALLFGDVINHGGKVSGDGGRITVVARDDISQYGGMLNVIGNAGDGGQISLTATNGYINAESLYAHGQVNGGSITASASDGIVMYGDLDAHGETGNGGSISLTSSQGSVYVDGSLDASGAINGGSVTLAGYAAYNYYGGYGEALLPFGDPSAIYVAGSIDASGGSGSGGTVSIDGYGEIFIYGDIDASGATNGGQITLRAVDGYYTGSVYVEGMLDASGTSGNGGLIDVYSSGDTYLYGDLLAWGGIDGGDISVTGAQVSTGSLLAYGSTGMGGSVSITADDIVLYGYGTYIDVQGDTGGGSIDLYARNNLVLGQNANLSADTGSSGFGGSIHLYAGNSLTAYGELSARGVDGGGSIFTGSGGGINLNGIDVDAGTISGDAGTWTISAPRLTVINGAQQGYISEGYYAGTSSDIQDNDLNNAFATGTNIVLEATNGFVDFDAPQIVAAFSSPLFLHVNATGSITGSGFSIASDGGALEMLFNANSAGGNTNSGYIDFSNASLSSNGGLIAMYGQSDLASGFASGYASGISLAGVDIDSGGGNVVLRGHSTGDDASSSDAGVYLDGTNIYSYGGDVEIHGTGAGDTNGVNASFGSIVTDGGNVSILGEGGTYDGIRMFANDIDSGGGNISLFGYGDDSGVYASYTSLFSAGGDIAVHGEGGTGNGVSFDSAVDSGGGNVTMYGYSADAIGLLFGGGSSGIVSHGGDIHLTGVGETFGVALYAGSYNGYNAFLPSDVGTINSGGGELVVTGTAAGADAVGVYLDGMQLIGGAGNVTVNGSAPLGTGIAFANGAGITTTTGNITLIGEGANFGLDLDFGDGALTTDSGDIGLYGYALAATATAGVRLTGSGLATNGGDVTIFGESAGGMGVQLGDSGGFAISSGGGDISVSGYGATTGVFAPYASMYSGGGNIFVHGMGGTGNGVTLSGPVDSEGGDVTMYGFSADAIGLVFGGYYSGIVSGGGDISLTGIGQTGGVALYAGGYSEYNGFLPSDAGTINSGGGQLVVTGTAQGTGAVGVSIDGIQLLGGAGDVTVVGSAPLGSGLLFLNGAGVSTTSGAISLTGEGANFGLNLGNGTLSTDTGDITLFGTATVTGQGVQIGSGGLETYGGDISIIGYSYSSTGVWVNGGDIASHGGDISISGTSANRAGVQISYSDITSDGGNILINGDGSSSTGLIVSAAGISSGAGALVLTGIGGGFGAGVAINRDSVISATSGDVLINGFSDTYNGILMDTGTVSTTSGDIVLIGIGGSVGLSLTGGEFSTDSGHIDLRGRGLGAASDGLLIGSGASIATNGGGIELSGEGGSGAGLSLGQGSSVDAGNSLVILRAGNDGSSDAIRLNGSIHSGMGVNLRPGGVDANGGLTERVDDTIALGGANGFALSATELALIDTPELIIGSSLHAGAIQVLAGVSRDGNLTLQNDGGSGGIDIQAAVNVGAGTLALSSAGSITQTSAGAITAHSLLANAGGDVLLAAAQNNVAATTLAGSAGGAFQFQDVDTLAIGDVSAMGFDASSNGLSTLGASGIEAGGDVFVRNLAGDLILNADVTGANIDLVTAGRLQNIAGASLNASGNWRVWASTWEGETRGGLAGSGNLPNLYGCTFQGSCGVTVSAGDNHFIYVQQPTAVITFDSFTREYGLPNPLLTFSVTGAILGDTAANVASGTATTTATIGSDVGIYPINGIFTSAAGYRIQLVPGTLGITPATLFFTADGALRYLGTPNPPFSGTVTGFRNNDTILSVFGTTVIWSSPAGLLSPVGFYAINGGTSAKNYVFAQAPGNATALQIIPLPQLPGTPTQIIRETVDTYVYDRNFGSVPMCALNASLEDQQLASNGDELSTEWSKVRSRPNLTNCFESERRNSCGDF